MFSDYFDGLDEEDFQLAQAYLAGHEQAALEDELEGEDEYQPDCILID